MIGLQPITNSFGVTTFGSAVIRVDPDIAWLRFTVSRLEQQPQEALEQAREAAQQVRRYLAQAEVSEVGTSRVLLSQSFKYGGGEKTFVGYVAKIAFNVLLHDLERVEEILIGITNAGANEIEAVDYHTSRLKELRAEARRRAVTAAREKAEIYCQAAEVALGPVIHLEDVNPDKLRGREGHVERDPTPDDNETPTAFNPESVVVGGAVTVAFELDKRS